MRVVARGMAMVGALALAGCGGDGERLTREEFVAQATAICEAADERTEDVTAELDERFGGGQDLTGEELQESVEVLAPVIDDTFDDLDELNPPEDLAEEFDEVIASGKEGSAQLKEAAASPEAIEAFFDQDDDPFAAIDEGFDELGLNACGSNE